MIQGKDDCRSFTEINLDVCMGIGKNRVQMAVLVGFVVLTVLAR